MFRSILIAAVLVAGLTMSSHGLAEPFDPQLTAIMNHIWATHPDVQGARSALEAARSRVDASDRPLYNPELEADYENAADNTFSVGLNQRIDWGNQRDARLQVANFKLMAARAELDNVRQRVAADVLTALARRQTVGELRDLAESRAVLMEQLSTTMNKRYAAGDVGKLDVALAGVAYSAALMRRASRDAEIAELQAELIASSGLVVPAWPKLPDEHPSPPATVNVEDLLDRLLSLTVLSAQSDAAEAGIAVARARRKADPTIGIRSGDEDGDSLVGVTLNIPLRVRNNFKAEVSVAKHEAARARQQYRSARIRSQARLKGSLERYRMAYAAWQEWTIRGQVGLAEQLDLLQRTWEVGELSASDYLVQAGQNVDTREAAAELTGAMWAAWFDWLAVSGQIEIWLQPAS